MPYDLISLLGTLVVIALVMAGAYAFTRWAGTRLSGGLSFKPGGSRLKILDRAALGKDQSLLMVQAGERYLLLGSTPTGLTLLAELTREEGEAWFPPAGTEPPTEGKPPDFQALLQRLREKNKSEKR